MEHTASEVFQKYNLENPLLLTIIQTILETESLNTAICEVFKTCNALFGVSFCFVSLNWTDGNMDEWVFSDTCKSFNKVNQILTIPIHNLREKTLQSGQIIYDNNLKTLDWTYIRGQELFHFSNALFIPLMFKKNTIGVLGLFNKLGGFIEPDLYLATSLGQHIGIDFHNRQTLDILKNNEEELT